MSKDEKDPTTDENDVQRRDTPEAPFAHETLDCYPLAVSVANAIRDAKFPRGDASLRVQSVKAAQSVVLNIAEGRSRRPDKSEAYHYRVALASAAEACATMDCVSIRGKEANQRKLRRIGAILRGLIRSLQ